MNFCYQCYEPYTRKERHKCWKFCSACYSETCDGWKRRGKKVDRKPCSECNRVFSNDSCFENHLKTDICILVKRCKSCHKLVDTRRRPKNKKQHVCGEFVCHTCGPYRLVNADHKCYIKPLKYRFHNEVDPTYVPVHYTAQQQTTIDVEVVEEEQNDDASSDIIGSCRGEDNLRDIIPLLVYYIFWDIESQLCQPRKDYTYDRDGQPTTMPEQQQNKIHVPNYLVAQIRCCYCEHVDEIVNHKVTTMHVSEYLEQVSDEDKITRCILTYEGATPTTTGTTETPRYMCMRGDHEMELHFVGQTCVADFCEFIGRMAMKYYGPPCEAKAKDPVKFREKYRYRTLNEEALSKMKRKYICIAHNAKGYDCQFVLQHYEQIGFRPKSVILQGMKIVSMDVTDNLRFLDSFNYVTCALAAFPATFGFKDDLSKQFFPYALNTEEYQNYDEFHLPDEHFYEPDLMKPSTRKAFKVWYAKNKSITRFVLRKALGEYCRSDVCILRRGILTFKDTIRFVTRKPLGDGSDGGFDRGINPFLISTTCASLTLFIYRYMFLQPKTLAIIDNDYVKQSRHSHISQIWLSWMNRPAVDGGVYNGMIQTARNNRHGEKSLPNHNAPRIKMDAATGQPTGNEIARLPLKVDGYDPITKTVFEFLGCRWHAHKNCFWAFVNDPNDCEKKIPRRLTKEMQQKLSMSEKVAIERLSGGGSSNRQRQQFPADDPRNFNQVWEDTNERLRYIQKTLGYPLVKIWECDFNRQLEKNPEMKEFVKNKKLELSSPLRPRQAALGGRVEVFKLFHECSDDDDERICYFDVCSLYPFIMKSKPYPVGHPTIHVDNFSSDPLRDYFGLIKCTVLPPRALKIPALPYPANGKLYFPLCRTCVESPKCSRKDPCTHRTDKERALTYTWTTVELKVAVKEFKYKILQLHEVWDFEEGASCDLFKEHMNTFIKLKQEASGKPDWVKTEAHLDQYIDNFLRRENIQLDPKNIEKNVAIRTVMKIFLNSLWGKFLQRTNQKIVKHCIDECQLFAQLSDPTMIINDLAFPSQETCVVTMHEREEFSRAINHINVVVATFTTSHARVELVHLIAFIDPERLIYCDTDSMAFIVRKGDTKVPETGDCVGQLTDEILKEHGEDAHIRAWVSVAPKMYAYEVVRTSTGEVLQTYMKAKGVVLNHLVKERLTFESFRTMAETHYEWFCNISNQGEQFNDDDDDDDNGIHFSSATTTTRADGKLSTFSY